MAGLKKRNFHYGRQVLKMILALSGLTFVAIARTQFWRVQDFDFSTFGIVNDQAI